MIGLSLILAAAQSCTAEPPQPLLARLERRCPGERVHILQLGDSHTAGDSITQPLRRILQLRFGAGGRGVLPPGRPYAGYLTHGVTAAQSGRWAVSAIFGPGAPAGQPVGLSGYTLTSESAGSTIGVASDDDSNHFDRFTVCAIAAPGAGSIRLRIGASEHRWDLSAARPEPACRSLDSESLASVATLTTEGSRPVSITSTATFRRAGGVAVSNLGVSGSQVAHLARADDAVLRAELEAYQPALIVLAFGTNEGFAPRFDGRRYEAELRTAIARLRRLAGRDVAIMLAAPPAAATRNLALGANAGPPVPACAPGIVVPSALAQVRGIQRRVAAEFGLGFVDAGAAMGERCSALAWASRGWMRPDLVHFTRGGGEQLGWMFAAALLQGAATVPVGAR